MQKTARLFRLTATSLVLGLSCHAYAQTSPASGPLPESSKQNSTGDVQLSDYLGLLQQIAPAAESGARTYLAAMRLRCGRATTATELRQAMSQGNGDPLLMGFIRAAHTQDTAARDQLIAQIQCGAHP
jgi:hypothetical protein